MILSSITSTLVNLIRGETVDDIIAPITRIIDRLKAHSEVHTQAAAEHAAEALKAAQAADASKQEASKAIAAAQKFGSLLS